MGLPSHPLAPWAVRTPQASGIFAKPWSAGRPPLNNRLPLPQPREARGRAAMKVEIVNGGGTCRRLGEFKAPTLPPREGDGMCLCGEYQTERLARIALTDPAHQMIRLRRSRGPEFQNPAARTRAMLHHIAARLIDPHGPRLMTCVARFLRQGRRGPKIQHVGRGYGRAARGQIIGRRGT
jgi:hypothetical protein